MMAVLLYVLPMLLSVESKASDEECLTKDAETLLFNMISGCKKCTNKYYNYLEKNCIGKGFLTFIFNLLTLLCKLITAEVFSPLKYT